MKYVTRNEILDYVSYEEQRDMIRAEAMRIKEPLRIHLGDFITFLFETKETVRYQIQEMMRIEHIVKESEIQHEIDTYNQLLGGPDELGCTLLIEIDDPVARDTKLKELMGLPKKLYLTLAAGDKIYAAYDPAQIGEDRLSAVQYLTFKTHGKSLRTIGADHPQFTLETELTPPQLAALAKIPAI
jgi:hypothetical protein